MLFRIDRAAGVINVTQKEFGACTDLWEVCRRSDVSRIDEMASLLGVPVRQLERDAGWMLVVTYEPIMYRIDGWDDLLAALSRVPRDLLSGVFGSTHARLVAYSEVYGEETGSIVFDPAKLQLVVKQHGGCDMAIVSTYKERGLDVH